MLLTGSPVVSSWPMPTGLKVQPLPPVVKVSAEEYESRDSFKSFEAVKARREALILESIKRYRPDVFLVDHAPAGMKGELLGALAFIRKEMPATRCVLGLRDILDSAEVVRDLWREQDIYHLLEKVVDILFPPKVSDDLRAVEDIAKTEHASGRRHLFADEGKSPKQFAFHARRSMVYQEYVGPIAFNRLENQRLPPRLHCFKAFKTVPGFVLFRADFDNRWEGLHLQTRGHGP